MTTTRGARGLSLAGRSRKRRTAAWKSSPASVPWSSEPTSSGYTAVAAAIDQVGAAPWIRGSTVSHQNAQPSRPSSSPPAADTAGPDGRRPTNPPSSSPVTAAYRANTAHPYVPWPASRSCHAISAPTASPDTAPLPIPTSSLAPSPGAVGPCSRSHMPHHPSPAKAGSPARPRPQRTTRPEGPPQPPVKGEPAPATLTPTYVFPPHPGSPRNDHPRPPPERVPVPPRRPCRHRADRGGG
ncbi:hypothetical protein LUX57_30645 [Actinomadura madurae]|uniref:hypothetical protein n=1 Tax=Actinomadura madurae TaxID=1993 RepID=UPI0020D230BA|nr:hypothetical protein [Actinomadura madurae]MCP9968998.1 hypothetical protein [Actinomadura madurae]